MPMNFTCRSLVENMCPNAVLKPTILAGAFDACDANGKCNFSGLQLTFGSNMGSLVRTGLTKLRELKNPEVRARAFVSVLLDWV